MKSAFAALLALGLISTTASAQYCAPGSFHQTKSFVKPTKEVMPASPVVPVEPAPAPEPVPQK